MNRAIALLLLIFISTAGSLLAQDSPIGVSLIASGGWLVPTNELAVSSTDMFGSSRASVEQGQLLGIAVQLQLPDPLPRIRLSVQQRLGAELIETGSGRNESVGSLSHTTVLAEAVLAPVDVGPVTPHVVFGAGFVRYGFPEISDEELSLMFEESAVSPAVSIGVGAEFGRSALRVLLEAADVISTFDSPPVRDVHSPEQTVDLDRVQHDLRLILGIRYPLWTR